MNFDLIQTTSSHFFTFVPTNPFTANSNFFKRTLFSKQNIKKKKKVSQHLWKNSFFAFFRAFLLLSLLYHFLFSLFSLSFLLSYKCFSFLFFSFVFASTVHYFLILSPLVYFIYQFLSRYSHNQVPFSHVFSSFLSFLVCPFSVVLTCHLNSLSLFSVLKTLLPLSLSPMNPPPPKERWVSSVWPSVASQLKDGSAGARGIYIIHIHNAHRRKCAYVTLRTLLKIQWNKIWKHIGIFY